MDDSSSFEDLKNKNSHPKQNANFLSNLFFCWGLPLFYKGWHKHLDEDDLYKPLKEHESHKLGDKLEEAWKLEKMSHDHPKLWRALWRLFKLEIIAYGFVLFVLEFILRLSQPLAIGKLMDFYAPNQTSVSIQEAYIYAGSIVVTSFLYVIVNHSYMLGLQDLGIKMRVACCSLIYRKSLKLSRGALVETTIGQMINLLSNDVNRFDEAGRNFHYLWAAPLESCIIMYLLYHVLGITAVAGFGLLIIFIPLQMVMGKLTSIYRLKTAIKTDERVRLMNEMISGIHVIKMYTWEKTFSSIVETIRRLEVKQIRNASYIRALHVSFSKFITRISVFICILAYALTGLTPNAEYVYVVSSFYNILKQAITTNFPQAVASLAETLVSMERIEQFLMFDEIRKHGSSYKMQSKSSIASGNVKPIGVNLVNASAKWSNSQPDYSLNNLNLQVREKELAAIVGSVGSGKTSLLHVILKELPLLKGHKDIVGSISYASQEPWLFAGTIKQNIIFGQEWDKKKYEQIIKVCALERDLIILPYGDRSIVGDRGVTLSGGQKARINLARAIYKDADIYLLDDPLSAVDTHVGKQLFKDCICGYLKNKCTILVTHQLQYLRAVDKIYLMENGNIASTGNYQEIQNSGKDFAKLFKDQLEDENDDTISEEELKFEDTEEMTDEPSEIKELRSTGTISSRVYKSYLKAGGGWCMSIAVLISFFLTQLVSSGADFFISFWVNLEQAKEENRYLNSSFYKSYFDDYLLEEEYGAIMASGIEADEDESFFTTTNCFYIYSGIIVFIVFSTVIRSISFYKFCMNASIKLHNRMFSKIINSSMPFFSSNPAGRILNRFSKDMGAVDEVCPYVLIDTIQIALNVLAVNVIIASINPWILVPTGIIAVLFYIYRTIYLATSRNVKRIESITRSPVFSHIGASLQGLTTIRAFGAEEILRKEFDNHQDLHSSAFYMFVGCNRTFGFWLDFHCVFYIALVTLSFFFMGHENYGGNVGLAITQAMSLTGMFQWGMRQWSELENSMTSVERVVEYTDIEQEETGDKKKPHKVWPEQGCLEFQSVYLRYAPNEPYVLNNLSFKIHPMEKVGIVGRTGAGKSSLIQALFRLATTEGKILIDGLNTKDIPLRSMRSKISIIPQEPIIFSGTLRSNLDPFNEYEDSHLWKAIEQVELKSAFHGLDSKMNEGGTNLSLGQRQLVCLARAIVRNNKILVLDEATANVDPKTDALIQTTIRTNFAKCTVLTIAHRLHTVMDSDKVLVMDEGSAVEFNHPFLLLQNADGIFSKLVKQTGGATSEHLVSIAKKNYDGLQKRLNAMKEHSE